MSNSTFSGGELVVDPKPSQVESATGDTSPIESMTELEAVLSARIIAKPLMLPQALTISVRNKGFYYRWVAYKAHGGQNLSKYQNMGFTKATLDDVDPRNERAAENPDGIVIGDLLLMKLPRELYLSKIKMNYEQANAATVRGGAKSRARQIKTVIPEDIPNDSAGNPLVDFYEPNDQDRRHRGGRRP